MALKKEDKVRFDGLKQTFVMLTTNGIEEAQIKTMMSGQFKEFESATNTKVKMVFGEDAGIELIDMSKDYLRTRFQNPENQVIRAKIEGVSIDVKIFKEGEFSLTNSEAVSALRALADEVEALDVELVTIGSADVRKMGSGDTEQLTEDDNMEDLGELEEGSEGELIDELADDTEESFSPDEEFDKTE